MKECVFCNFAKKKNKFHEMYEHHKQNYPLIFIEETEDTLTFLSHPRKDDSIHLLIIPKEHYEFLEEMPERILKQIFLDLQKSSEILRKKYSSCRIILNNGKNAEQYVKHVHFHLVPYSKNKKNPWEGIDVENFHKLSNEMVSLWKNKKE
jgi:diadenosine tetraphosphate (Ap4A) HIT family hydrolase